MVTLFSVTLIISGAPGADGNVLGSGVRCRLLAVDVFSTCFKGRSQRWLRKGIGKFFITEKR